MSAHEHAFEKGRGLKVLISGGAGFIGTHLSRELLNRGHTVAVLDNLSPQIHGSQQQLAPDIRDCVQLWNGDVRDRGAWVKALNGQEAIVHLAAETGTGQSMYEVARYEQVNLSGTALFYDLLAQGSYPSVQRIVVASSRAIYGEGAYLCAEHGTVYPSSRSSSEKKAGLFEPVCPVCRAACHSVPTPESAPLQPSSFYGLTKQVQEQMAMIFAPVLHIPTIALRYQNVYGVGQSLTNPYTGILAVFSNLARAGKPINVFEDGLESRDFVAVQDVARATADCLELQGTESHALNIGSGVATTVRDVAEAVNDFFGGGSTVSVSGAFRDGDVRHGLADLARASSVIGYASRVSFAEGVVEFLRWAESNTGSDEGAYRQSLSELEQRGMLFAGK